MLDFLVSPAATAIGIVFTIILGTAAIWGIWSHTEKPAPTLRESIQDAKEKGRWE